MVTLTFTYEDKGEFHEYMKTIDGAFVEEYLDFFNQILLDRQGIILEWDTDVYS